LTLRSTGIRSKVGDDTDSAIIEDILLSCFFLFI